MLKLIENVKFSSRRKMATKDLRCLESEVVGV